MTFASLGLSPELVSAIDDRGYTEPTPVQLAAIPAVLAGRDVWACAQTGSGKTAAFALPLLQRLLGAHDEEGHRVRAVILVPTRELAAQVGESFRLLARSLQKPIKVASVYGGVSINPQMMGLRGGADFVVATPGRLLDLVDRNALRLGAVETLVLDEADRLIDLGFADELRAILERLPAQRQNLLFSATFPSDVEALALGMLRDPLRIDLPPAPALEPAIEQRSIRVDQAKRTPLLRHLIAECRWTRVLVFVATKYSTEHIAAKLRQHGIKAAALHGELSQATRAKALADFRNSQLQVLVATDIAARGIHIDKLPAVVNYTLCSGLHPPHRTYRTRRRTGRCDQLCQRRRRAAFPPDREAAGIPVASRNPSRLRADRGSNRDSDGNGRRQWRYQGQAQEQEGQAAGSNCARAGGGRLAPPRAKDQFNLERPGSQAVVSKTMIMCPLESFKPGGLR